MRSSTRRQLKQDQFAEAAMETVHWAAEHRQKLIWGGIIVAIVLGIGLSIWAYRAHRESQAVEAFGHAMQVYAAPLKSEDPAAPEPSYATSAERSKAAHDAFSKVAAQFSGLPSGKKALYLSGVTALDIGDKTSAERDFQQVINSAGSDVASLAKLALANLYRDSGRQQDAVKLYKDLIDHPTHEVPKAYAQLQLAAVFTSSQPAEAKRIYEDVKKENPQSPAAQAADMRLQSIQ